MSFHHRTVRLPLAAAGDADRWLHAYAGGPYDVILRHDWTPVGATLVATRDEVTFVLHTWPEYGFATLDIITAEGAQRPAEIVEADFGEG